MSKNLPDKIFENFLKIIENDENIGKNLGQEIYKALYKDNSSKEAVLDILKKEANNNENWKYRDWKY